MSSFSPTIINCDLNEDIFEINLNREKVYNALNKDAKLEIISAIEYANKNDGIKVIILSASGKAFCTGQDLNDRTVQSGASTPDLENTLKKEWNPLIESIRDSQKTVIGAINGMAVGAGLSLALACDLIICHPQAFFMSGFSKIGLCPDAGSTFAITKALGRQRAMKFFLFNEQLSTQDLLTYGLINSVSGNPLETARNWASQMTMMAPLSLQTIKNNVISAMDSDFNTCLDKEIEGQTILGKSNDYQEGLKAFFEKRAPNFSGN